MAFRETRDANAEALRAGVPSALIEAPDAAHEVGGVLEGVRGTVVVRPVLGRVATKGHDVAYPGLRVPLEDLADLGFPVQHAREVGNGL